MNRMFVAGAATALTLCAAAWGALQYTQPAKAAADGTLGMAQMSAVVALDGTLVRASGAVSVSKTGTGVYGVTFNRSVVDCSYVGGIGYHTPGGAVGSSTVAVNPSLDGNSAAVRVFTQQSTTAASIDQNFHVLVFCHK